MASSNRVRLVSTEETTLGVTPNTPRMRTRRFTGENLKYAPTFVESAEIRSDRMTPDPIETGTQSDGDVKFELIYPFPGSPLDSDIKSALYNTWTAVNFRNNDGVAASAITGVAALNDVVTVVAGTAFVAGELYRFTGFANAANNGVFLCSLGSATVPQFAAAGMVDEAVPPGTARVKCVGLEGASGDITATSTGLASTTLDFTTIAGLAPGKWIKLGGTGAGNRFATAADNDWARITAVAAHAVTLDNLPAGWGVDSGAGVTLKIWFGDQIKNGTIQLGQSLERGYLGQAAPTYIVQRGMVVTQFQMTWAAKAKIDGSFTYLGLTAGESRAVLSVSPDPPLAIATYPVFACSANVGRVGEFGAQLAAPNYVKQLTFLLANNATPTEAMDHLSPVDIVGHECKVTGQIDTYFGDDTLLARFYAASPTSINVRAAKNFQAIVLQFPRVTYNGPGSPNAAAKNQDVMLTLPWQASKDEALTNALILLDRLEYFEA